MRCGSSSGTLGIRAFAAHADPERVGFPAEYDLIRVGSLFSHLPRQPFAAWVRRLARQLTPRGVLAFTTLGPEMIAGGVGPDGFRFEPISETERLPEAEYGNTNVHSWFVERELGRVGMALLAHRPRALWRSQDLFVVGRPDRDALADWQVPATVRGTVVGPRASGDGRGRLEGVVGVSGSESLEAVFLRTPHRDLGEAWRGPAHAAAEGDGLVRDWFLEGPLEALGPPPRRIAARARLRRGEQQTFAVAALD